LNAHRTIRPTEASWIRGAGDVGRVRRLARRCADACGLDAEAVALCTTEIGSNLTEHGGGGWMQVWHDGVSLHLAAVDRASPPATPAPGLGAGLQTVRQHAARVDIDDAAAGHCITARFGPPDEPARVGVVMLPLGGHELSGDGVLVELDGEGLSIVVVDVLGHGPAASEDRDRLFAALAEVPLDDPRRVASASHDAMRGRRGAALMWAHVSPRRLRSFGIGNVSGEVIDDTTRSLVSEPGMVGRHERPPRVDEREVRSGAWLLLATDGILSRGRRPPLADRHSVALAAASTIRDHSRQRDDATVLIARCP